MYRQDANAIGPRIGTAPAPAPLVPTGSSLPAPVPSAFNAATVSSGPQPASLYPTPPPPVMLPPLHYQGMDSAQPFGFQPPPMGAPMMPGRPPMPGMPPQTGMVRSADQMEGAGDDVPPAKRQKIAKLPGGAYYPEADWINMHPVRPLFHAFLAVMLTLTFVAPHRLDDPNAERPVKT